MDIWLDSERETTERRMDGDMKEKTGIKIEIVASLEELRNRGWV